MNPRDLLLRVEMAEKRAHLAEIDRQEAEATANFLWIRVEKLETQINDLGAWLDAQGAA